MDKDILWVGVSFGSENEDQDKRLLTPKELKRNGEQHGRIVDAITDPEVIPRRFIIPFPNESTVTVYPHPELGVIVDLYDATGGRIGFGIGVYSLPRGRSIMDQVRVWLSSMGISDPVEVWVWNPDNVPSWIVQRADSETRNAGV